MLPVGTGCDLLRTFGLPQDVAGAALHLTGDRHFYDIDVGTLEGIVGSPLFRQRCPDRRRGGCRPDGESLSRRLGAARYPLAFAARLPGFPRATVKITTERRTIESDALAVILANAQYFAGGWNVAPKPMLVDGALDVQIINCRKTYAPALVPKVIKGTHLSDPRCEGSRRPSSASTQTRSGRSNATAILWGIQP